MLGPSASSARIAELGFWNLDDTFWSRTRPSSDSLFGDVPGLRLVCALEAQHWRLPFRLDSSP